MKQYKIVIIEDEPDILQLIEYNLSREGYKIYFAQDGNAGLNLVQKEMPDLVVMDLMLPIIDGLEICRILKNDSATGQIPIIMVTAKGEESDIVLGLGMGADDYIVKPFSIKELVARIKTALRRGQLKEKQEGKGRIVINGLSIDAGKFEVRIDGKAVFFTATEFRLLHYFASSPGQVFTRDQLLSSVMGDDVLVIDRNIDVHIRAIRMKIGPYRDMIETIRGIGYRFKDE